MPVLPYSHGIVQIITLSAMNAAIEGKVNACRFPAKTGGTPRRGPVHEAPRGRERRLSSAPSDVEGKK